MKRRTFIAGAGSAAIAVAGCLDRSDDGTDEENDDGGEGEQGYTEYEECPLYVIDVDDLPDRAWDEAVTAIEVGELETEGRVVLDEVLDFDETYLAYDDTYYALDIEWDDDQATVTAEEELDETEDAVRSEHGIDDRIALIETGVKHAVIGREHVANAVRRQGDDPQESEIAVKKPHD